MAEALENRMLYLGVDMRGFTGIRQESVKKRRQGVNCVLFFDNPVYSTRSLNGSPAGAVNNQIPVTQR